MIDWKYNPENYNADGYELIPAGDYRVRIDEAVEKVSQTGKDMVRMKLKVNGYNSPIWFYLVFDNTSEDGRKRTDQRLGSIYDSFGIPRGNLNFSEWQGKIGGARLKNRTDANGDMRSEVHYFLSRKKTDILPAFIEDKPKTHSDPDEAFGNFGFDTAGTTTGGDDSDIPF